jgi:DNA-binding transcriptional MocR family regulator
VIEREIAGGRLPPDSKLPPVRELAAALAVSPATVSSAYRTLRARGLTVTARRRGTSVAPVPPVRVKALAPLPEGVRDLASGNPDPELLPSLPRAFAAVEPVHRLYGEVTKSTELVSLAAAGFADDGVRGDVAITSGALDAIERALQTSLRAGDAVVVEDPSWPRIADLVRALGLRIVPVALDGHGLLPDRLAAALQAGARAVIATPRGQNPTGAAVDRRRGRELREVVADHHDVLVVEDDYVARVAGAPYVPLHNPDGRFLVVRSLSKVLGPDLRVALATGDPLTVSRVEGRQLLGPGWVSHVLQQLAARLLADKATARLLARAERLYAERRAALVAALDARGIPAFGATGLGIWIPISDEAAVVRELLVRGWAVSPGERYRFESAQGVRVTTAGLSVREAEKLADALADALQKAPSSTYSG